MRAGIVVVAALAALMTFVGKGSAPAQAAGPDQPGPVCAWRELDSSMLQTAHNESNLIALPDRGVLWFDSGSSWNVRVLDLQASATGTWMSLQASGYRPIAPQGRTLAYWASRGIGPGAHELLFSTDQYGASGNRIFRLHVVGASASWCEPMALAAGAARYVQAQTYFPIEESLIGLEPTFRGGVPEGARAVRLKLADPVWGWEPLPLAGTSVGGLQVVSSLWYEPIETRMVGFGEAMLRGVCAQYNDLWFLDLAGGSAAATWSSVATAGAPLIRANSGVVALLPRLNAIMLIGIPCGSSVFSRHTWLLDLTTTPPSWHELSVASLPGSSPFGPGVTVVGALSVANEDVVILAGLPYRSNTNTISGIFCTVPAVPEAAAQATAQAARPARPDLVASRVAYSPLTPDHRANCLNGSAAHPLTICVRNAGRAAAGRFAVAGDDGTRWEASGLGAGQEVCFPAQASTARSITVDPDDRVDEADESNNVRRVSPPSCRRGAAYLPLVRDG